MSIPDSAAHYLTIAEANYPTIQKNGVTNDSLSKYFKDCFDGICKSNALYKCWVCVRCMELNKASFGFGDKPDICPSCGKKTTYEVATFNARASHVGEMFQWAFWLLLKNYYGIDSRPTSNTTRLYDLEIRPDVVIEAKGSPRYVINQDGSHSKLERAGMMRSDTEKKAFANAEKWNKQFPNGHFFVVTSALPNHLHGYRSNTVKAIYDITKKSQIESLIADLKTIGITGST
jgi:hypothetical protein